MKIDPFVHLHVHSHYSLLDGACKIDELIEEVRRHRMDAVALTDHGNLFGAIEFYRTALAAGVKPIIGCEAYVALGSRTDRAGEGASAFHHVTLLVKDEHGYKNLLKLASAAYLEGFYYKPRIDMALLGELHGGLIALSGCMKGPISQKLSGGDVEGARRAAVKLRDLVGEENLYIELMDNGVAGQRELNKGLLEIARELSVPPVATNDVHYLRRDDADAHDCLICIGHGKTVDDTSRVRYPSDQFYLRSGDEMRALFDEVPEAAGNTRVIADRCNLEIRSDERHLPRFSGDRHKPNRETFRDLCEAGARNRYGDPLPAGVRERLEYEMGVIERMGYISYFLIVHDFVNYARSTGIPVGYRGSCGGSLVAYSLAITTIDPLRYNIIFERFLDEQRKEAPDIDIDLCMHGREKVLQYVLSKYGADRMTQIITFGTLGARAVIRDVGRVLDVPLNQVDAAARQIPGGPGVRLAEAIEQSDELRKARDADPKVRRWFDTALKLEGTCRHASTHAAGVIIADKPLTEYLPLYKNGDDVVSQYDMNSVDYIGLLKFDFLGLRTLTVIDTALKIIHETHGVDLDVDNLPLDDSETFALLSRGDTRGVFQLESSGFRELLTKLRPDRFEDIIAVNALYRPAAIQAGVIDDFINARRGKTQVTYKHPILKEVLEETCGVMAYQDQVMQIVHRLAGISLADALTLIKAISKKKRDIIADMRDDFIAGAVKNGVARKTAEEIFELVEYFGGYGFNKSHSAAYAMVAFKTAYLKAHYPLAFMAALLTSEAANTDKIVMYMEDCKRMGIPVLPPAINEGFARFSVDGGNIRFGLAAVKNVGDKTVEAMVSARDKGGPFADIYDFCERVEAGAWNRAALESLVKCGAFDCTGWRRAQVIAALDAAMEHGNQAQRDRRAGQKLLFGGQGRAEPRPSGRPELPEWDRSKLLQFEKESLGFYCSSHPLEEHATLIRRYSTVSTRDLPGLDQDEEVRLGCMIAACRVRPTKNGERMAWAMIEDLDGQAEAVVFPRTFAKYEEMMVDGKIVFLAGKVDLAREQPSLRVDGVTAIERAAEIAPKRVTIRLDSADAELLDRMRGALKGNTGDCPVFITMDGTDGKRYCIQLGSKWTVSPRARFAEEVEEIVGKGKVVFG